MARSLARAGVCLAMMGVLVAAAPERGWTRSNQTAPYPIADMWPTAIRFLRIDRGFPIRERDDAAGYILFDYIDGAKKYRGSLELIRTTDEEGRNATGLTLTLPDLPRRYEGMLLDKLLDKARQDHGPPSPPPARTPAPQDKPGTDAGDGLPRAPTSPDFPHPPS